MRPLLIAVRRVVIPAAAEPVATMAGSSSPFMAVAVAVAPVLVLLFGVIRAVDFLYLGDSLL
jgi:hypothetical protein